jgi:hypothetical protein
MIFVPFNFQPSVSGTTYTSRTVGAANYALIKADLDFGWLTINGNAIICAGHQAATLASNSTATTATFATLYTVPASRIYELSCAITRSDGSGGTATYQLQVLDSLSNVKWSQSIGGIADGATATFGPFMAGPGDVIQTRVTSNTYSGNSKSLSATTYDTPAKQIELWVDSSSVVTLDEAVGSLRYTEYPKIS